MSSIRKALTAQPSLATDNLKNYLSVAALPLMIHGATAPPMPPSGHKAHLNHLKIKTEEYRWHFVKIVTCKQEDAFDKAVLAFLDIFPCEKLGVPALDDSTGYAFTVPAPGFDIHLPSLPRPTSVQELVPWITSLPLQTMARALHVAFPETAGKWDFTHANQGDDHREASLWHTLVWRKTPPPSNLEKYWNEPVNPLETCSLVFAVQPPWIMTPQDFKSFLRCTSLPPYNIWDPEDNKPLKAAERVWAKLWDTCVRRRCHHWVLSTYWGWVFGAFSKGFSAGQIFDMKYYDACEPSVLQCLVYHVACSMGLVPGSQLPQYFETPEQLEWNPDIPEPSHDVEVEYPDSESDWDGMDDEPGVSAGVSDIGFTAAVSTIGSERVSRRGRARVLVPEIARSTMLHPDRVMELLSWDRGVNSAEGDGPSSVAQTRLSSPSPSEAGLSIANLFRTASETGGSDAEPEGSNVLRNVSERGEREAVRRWIGDLQTISEQTCDDVEYVENML